MATNQYITGEEESRLLDCMLEAEEAKDHINRMVVMTELYLDGALLEEEYHDIMNGLGDKVYDCLFTSP